MPDFRTYWQQKEAKLRENWDARYKSFIAKHCSLEEIRETVLRPADYAWNFAGQESFLSTHIRTIPGRHRCPRMNGRDTTSTFWYSR